MTPDKINTINRATFIKKSSEKSSGEMSDDDSLSNKTLSVDLVDQHKTVSVDLVDHQIKFPIVIK